MNQNFKQDDISLNNRILDALSENDIQNFLIHTKTTDSEELFFVKKEKVLHRGKHLQAIDALAALCIIAQWPAGQHAVDRSCTPRMKPSVVGASLQSK